MRSEVPEAFLKTRLIAGYRYKNRVIAGFLIILDSLLAVFPHRYSPLPADPRSILIMKPDHLGDLLMLTSVLPLLTERYPQASVDLLCGPWGTAVLSDNPSIRKIVKFGHLLYDRRTVSPFRKLLDFCKSVGHTVKQMRGERYDLCLNFRDAGGDLILLARVGGCRHIIGHGTGGLRSLLDTEVKWSEGVHEVQHYLEVLKPLGIDASLDGLHYMLFPQQSDHERVNCLLRQHRLESFVVIHPGSGDVRKLRPVSFWADLVEGVDASFQVVFTGTKDEEHICADICRHTGRKILSLAGQMTVVQLCLFMQKSAGIHALDSLAAHLGAAAGVNTVVYWSQTNDPGQWRPLGGKVELRF